VDCPTVDAGIGNQNGLRGTRTDTVKRPVRLLGVGVHGLLERDDLLPSSQVRPLEFLAKISEKNRA
jgi:hypothetical protein